MVCIDASKRREVLSSNLIAKCDLHHGPSIIHRGPLAHAPRNTNALTRLAPTGARDKAATRSPRSLLLLKTNARRAEKADCICQEPQRGDELTADLHWEQVAVWLSPARL